MDFRDSDERERTWTSSRATALYLSVRRVSSNSCPDGLTATIITSGPCLRPIRFSWKSYRSMPHMQFSYDCVYRESETAKVRTRVSFDSRKGTIFCRLGGCCWFHRSVSRHRIRFISDPLILLASWMRSPLAPVLALRSEPARSTIDTFVGGQSVQLVG